MFPFPESSLVFVCVCVERERERAREWLRKAFCSLEWRVQFCLLVCCTYPSLSTVYEEKNLTDQRASLRVDTRETQGFSILAPKALSLSLSLTPGFSILVPDALARSGGSPPPPLSPRVFSILVPIALPDLLAPSLSPGFLHTCSYSSARSGGSLSLRVFSMLVPIALPDLMAPSLQVSPYLFLLFLSDLLVPSLQVSPYLFLLLLPDLVAPSFSRFLHSCSYCSVRSGGSLPPSPPPPPPSLSLSGFSTLVPDLVTQSLMRSEIQC